MKTRRFPTRLKVSFARFFGRRSEDTSGARRRIQARPSLEGIEERVVLSPAWIGSYTSPGWSYPAGSQRVAYWAQVVGGPLTANSAQAAWSQAMVAEANGQHGTLLNNGQAYTTTGPGDFLLIGCENLSTHTGGWVAARYNTSYQLLVKGGSYLFPTWHTVTHTTMNWMASGIPMHVGVEGPHTVEYTTNGYTIDLTISPDSSTNMHVSFTTPHLQPAPAS